MSTEQLATFDRRFLNWWTWKQAEPAPLPMSGLRPFLPVDLCLSVLMGSLLNNRNDNYEATKEYMNAALAAMIFCAAWYK